MRRAAGREAAMARAPLLLARVAVTLVLLHAAAAVSPAGDAVNTIIGGER